MRQIFEVSANSIIPQYQHQLHIMTVAVSTLRDGWVTGKMVSNLLTLCVMDNIHHILLVYDNH